MAEDTLAPFSARNRGAHRHIENDFPASARIGLQHCLYDFIRRRYISSWQSVIAELERIARYAPEDYAFIDDDQARTNAYAILNEMPWDRVFDFCERTYSYLAKE